MRGKHLLSGEPFYSQQMEKPGMIFEETLTRRQFVKKLGLMGLQFLGLTALISCLRKRSTPPSSHEAEGLHEARYYRRLTGELKDVQCNLCFRQCAIPEAGRGLCLARENRGGKLCTLVYGKPVAVHIDPIEKEPMYHMYPGSDTLCVGTASCNFRCLNCINWHIAFKAPEEVEAVPFSPKEIVKMAIEHEVPTICFTYNDPIVLYEYMFDIANLAREEGLNVTFHSNGSFAPKPLRTLLHYMNAVAIDLKAFNAETHRKLTTGELLPVLETLKTIKEEGVWLEIVHLVIPSWTDKLEDIEKMCRWIKDELGEETPVHFSRFFPACKLTNLHPTPLQTLEEASLIAQEVGLQYVYIGNVTGHQRSNTFCPNCGELLIRRRRFMIVTNNIEGGRCRFCGYEIPGLWE